MDKVKGRIAVASSDGIVVNSHFGRTAKFYIYDESDEKYEFIEERDADVVCDKGNHDENSLLNKVKSIADCDFLLVSKIGDGALRVVEEYGIEAYEIPGIIDDSIKKLTQFIKLKDLFL
ncbi:MAG: dinitrogenase iron-molybdenum cofactor biosynthesis protein [Eubacterium sp.]|nr:dinitrogenase iron-molybdenum cofactor biosynthesis protein [Eubacterium sp.]